MSEPTTVLIQNLIQRMQTGDDKARAELIACAQQRLERLTRKMMKGFTSVRRWEDTVDVRQNASMRLWRALNEVTPADAVHFFRLAATQIRRELIDLARHYSGPEGMAANIDSVANDGGSESPSPLQQSPAEDADAGKLAEWTEFHEQVEKLPDEERAAYDLLWYQELTHDEAAHLLNLSVWTVRRHYRNAKLRLHNYLGGEAPA